jgi:hypothetical protein
MQQAVMKQTVKRSSQLKRNPQKDSLWVVFFLSSRHKKGD